MKRREATQVYRGAIALIGVRGFYEGRELHLRRGERAILGRDRGACALLYPQTHAHISAMHCSVHVDASDRVYLTDLHSRNGTFLRDARLPPDRPWALWDGDEFTLSGTERFRVRID